MPALAARRPPVALVTRPGPLVLAALALAIGLVVGLVGVVGDEDLGVLAWFVSAPALVVLAIGLVGGLPTAMAVGVGGLGLVNAIDLAEGSSSPSPVAPLVGVALFVIAELAYASFDLRRVESVERPALVAHAARVGVVSAAALAIGSLLLAVAETRFGTGVAARVTGLVAAGGVVGMAAFLLRRAPRRPRRA